ncbi:uncharacterized protein [Dysidea avara]|uniref:uncharacterized protein n=1 Tax=Dysidea avara TaxID=196820 RepID=UPI00331853D6
MYADDTELHYSSSQLERVEQVLQNGLEEVSNWMSVNGFKLNIDKSVCMLIGTRQRVSGGTLCLSLNDSMLKQVTSTKYLDYVLKRVRGKIYSINRLKPPPTVRKLLYQVYLLPILEYCDVVWQPTNASQTRRLERFHSKYISLCNDSSISGQSLTERRKFHTILQTYKVLHKLAPDYLHGIFEYAVNVTGRISRNAHCLFVPQLRTNYGKRSLYYRGVAI